MIYLYLFGTCFHFIYVFMIIGNIKRLELGYDVSLNSDCYIQCVGG